MDYNKMMIPLMMIARRAKPDERIVNELIKNKLWYTIDISFIYPQISNVFNAMSDTSSKSAYSCKDDTIALQCNDHYGVNNSELFIYKRTPMLLLTRFKKDVSTTYSLSTLNTKACREKMHEFLNACLKVRHNYYFNSWEGQIDMVDYGGRNGRYVMLDNKTFDDIFLPHEQECAIKNGINSFIKNIKWMESKHIPSHYGILLYGTPGCGRTSIIKAIINEWNMSAHYIQSLHDLPQLVIEQLPKQPMPTDNIHMVICEDIDCTLFNRQKSFKESEDVKEEEDSFGRRDKKVSLSQVLNSIDGLVAPHNTIFVFTTNHIEELDPALIRPGRMDLHLEIKPICEETLNKFCLKFFNKEIPKDFKCKEGELFSTLQTKIIGGSTYEDILNYMKEEEVYNEEQ